MNPITRLFGFRSRDKPQNKVGSAFSFLFGGTTSGKPVNERTAMQTTAVYACVRILAEAVASLPLHIYRYNDDDGKERVTNHPLYYLLHDEPNPEMTSFVFRETLMSHLLLWGNAYSQIVRDGRGRVMALYPLLKVFMLLFWPFTELFLLWKKLLKKVFRIKNEAVITEDELLTYVETAESEGGIKSQDRKSVV